MTISDAPDASFDRYARMVRRALGVPVALVSLVERDRQVFPGAVGLPEPWQTERETPLSHSFCQYVVADRSALVISDAREDERLKDNLAIPDLGVVAYAGFPLTDHQGTVIGSLCAIDGEPHDWTDTELETLADLAASCSGEIAQRELRDVATEQAERAGRSSRRTQLLLALSEGLAGARTYAEIATALESAAIGELQCLRAGMWLRPLTDPARAHEPLAPAAGGETETLQLVLSADTVWESAMRWSLLPADAGNPLGLALVSDIPLFFSERRDQDARFPALINPAQIGQARAFLPLSIGHESYGTLVLLWEEPRDFSNEDRAVLAALASYTTQAVQRATMLAERVEAARLLQNAMIARLPQTDWVTLSARYRPASSRNRVGGDWYDAAVLPDGHLSLTVGDVVGHDLVAATDMGRLQNMLSALDWANVKQPPSEVVRQLDQACSDLGHEAMATLVHARVERNGGPTYRLRWTSAGHLAPVLVGPEGRARLLDQDPGLDDVMLGVVPWGQRHDHEVEIEAGSTLLLYTDGLVERRDDADLDLGLQRLVDVVTLHGGLSVAHLVDVVTSTLVGDRSDDDVVVLAARFG